MGNLVGRQFNYDFVRPSGVDGVFEHVDIDSMGKRVEAVYCRVFVSPLRGHRVGCKPSPEVEEFLSELADPAVESRYSLIESVADAKGWETRVADVAPSCVRALAQQHAALVAGHVASARESAVEYARLIRECSDEPVMEYLAVQLKAGKAPEKGSATVGRAGIVVSQADLRDALECASLAIAKFGQEIDPKHNGFQGESESRNREQRLRIDLIADLLRCG